MRKRNNKSGETKNLALLRPKKRNFTATIETVSLTFHALNRAQCPADV